MPVISRAWRAPTMFTLAGLPAKSRRAGFSPPAESNPDWVVAAVLLAVGVGSLLGAGNWWAEAHPTAASRLCRRADALPVGTGHARDSRARRALTMFTLAGLPAKSRRVGFSPPAESNPDWVVAAVPLAVGVGSLLGAGNGGLKPTLRLQAGSVGAPMPYLWERAMPVISRAWRAPTMFTLAGLPAKSRRVGFSPPAESNPDWVVAAVLLAVGVGSLLGAGNWWAEAHSTAASRLCRRADALPVGTGHARDFARMARSHNVHAGWIAREVP
ncbi:hypothetical protein M2262_003661 [Pseudomonas sp. BIGb0408]|uniref:Uncharacterized protein n=1 Tax=Phytopseudomonas flavescens TaxID=29435 RepID=A0A7Y9XKJ6_9GAMM|nr:hypothetical protein [Pseudomonas sp. BIGb0408]NYH71819.1 hypothetical protein [Pseudomonas flavescens]